MIKKILAVLAGIGAFFSAVFYVLFKQAKDEQKQQELEIRAKEAECNAAAAKLTATIARRSAELKKEDEELAQKSHSGNELDNFNAGLDRLRKSSKRGQERNTGAGKD